MAGGPEDHFTDSREPYVLVEGHEWAHWRARAEKAVIEPSSLQRRNSSSSSRKSRG
jgi:hypothetical protein